MKNPVTARNLTADLQGDYPRTEANPLLLTNVKVEALGGKITMQQLRMPQHDPALLRVDNISSSELISAVNPKQFAMSGPVSGALPFWLDNEKWIIKDGWLTNPGPMTLRIDQDTADAIVKDNVVAGAAINWLRYMEISQSWTKLNVDNLGVLTMQAAIKGTSRVEGKSSFVNLNYTHEENILPSGAACALGTICKHGLSNMRRYPFSAVRQARKVRNNNEKEGWCTHRGRRRAAVRLHAAH